MNRSPYPFGHWPERRLADARYVLKVINAVSAVAVDFLQEKQERCSPVNPDSSEQVTSALRDAVVGLESADKVAGWAFPFVVVGEVLLLAYLERRARQGGA